MKIAPVLNREIMARVSRAFQLIVGMPVFVLGLAGIPEDLATWERWIERVTRDERVLELARQAMNVAEWLNQPIIRIILVLMGIALLLWRVPWFFRFRNRVVFQGRQILSDEVWINSHQALSLLRNSEWGQLKRPRTSTSHRLIDVNWVTGGESHTEKRSRKFALYIQKSLDSFEEDNPTLVQKSENGKLYEQGGLQKFVEYALNAELFDEFGRLPGSSVTD